MAELITRTVVELEQLAIYHELNKAYIDAGLAKKWESATFDEATRKVSFYTVPQPSGDVEPVFTFTLPEVDFTEVYNAIDALEEKVDKNAADIASINHAETGILKQAKDYADTQVKTLADGTVKENTDAIAKLNGDAETEGSVAKTVADAKKLVDADIADINEKIGEVPEGKTVAEMIAEAEENATYDDTQLKADIASNAKAIEDEIARAKEAEETNATAINTEKERAMAAEKANADDIDALEGRTDTLEEKVTTLIGDDAGKSARTIANEELAKQLIADGAKESLDTLAEIAQWIQSHPDDASAMNKAIGDLEALVGTLPEGVTATTIVGYIQEIVNAEKTRAEGVEAGLNTRLETVEQAIGEGGSVETQITNAIADLDADVTSATVEEGKGVQVQVVEVDGKLTNVVVTGNYDNAYDAKGAAATAKTEAVAAVTALEEGQVATNTQAIADNAAAIAAIKYATEQDIRDLWN